MKTRSEFAYVVVLALMLSGCGAERSSNERSASNGTTGVRNDEPSKITFYAAGNRRRLGSLSPGSPGSNSPTTGQLGNGLGSGTGAGTSASLGQLGNGVPSRDQLGDGVPKAVPALPPKEYAEPSALAKFDVKPAGEPDSGTFPRIPRAFNNIYTKTIDGSTIRAGVSALKKMETDSGSNTVMVIVGRSLPLLSALADQFGKPNVTIPGSKLGYGLEVGPDPKIEDPSARNEDVERKQANLSTYKQLIKDSLLSKLDGKTDVTLSVADFTYTGLSLLAFHKVLKEVASEISPNIKVNLFYLDHPEMSPEAKAKLDEAGATSLITGRRSMASQDAAGKLLSPPTPNERRNYYDFASLQRLIDLEGFQDLSDAQSFPIADPKYDTRTQTGKQAFQNDYLKQNLSPEAKAELSDYFRRALESIRKSE